MNPFTNNYTVEEEETEIIKQAQKGSESALDKLLRMHQPYVYNIAWKMVRNPTDAEDLTQEALVKVTINLSKFNFKSQFRTWAYRIVVNHFLNMKKQAHEHVFTSFESTADRLNSVPDVELNEEEKSEKEALIKEMGLGCLSGMLLCLDRTQRLVYIIGHMFGADHNIGSEIMEMSKTNFRMKLSRARKDMHSFMSGQCGLMDESNPCRCHKKVTAAVNGGYIDAKNLLFNREEYSTFQKEIEKDDTDLRDFAADKFVELKDGLSYKTDFDKKSFIKHILEDIKIRQIMNLN
ncbi:MAG: sigma-70 family RNA polymerase sigma factor [Bacteroidota bacterium]